ncbi:uncharacterized protein [Brachyistius frenatus]|uniref:uncharacterized protein isoform X9 n=1 Tax=Brachyistius frenatus TaxID=100188 RepID=UPI0037E7C2FC
MRRGCNTYVIMKSCSGGGTDSRSEPGLGAHDGPGSVGPGSVVVQVRLVQVLWCPGSVSPGSVVVQVRLVQVLLLSRFGWSRFCCCPGSVGPDSVGFQVLLVQVLLVSRFCWCRFGWCPGSVGPGSVGVQVRLVQVLLLSRFCWFPGSVGPGSVGVQVLLMQVRLVSRFGWSRFCCCPGSVGPDSVGFQVRLVQVLLVSRFGWCRFCWCPGSVGPGSVIVQVWLVQVLLLSRFCWSRFCWFPGSVGPGSVGIQVLLVQVRLVQVLLLSRFGWSRFGWCPGSVGLGSVGVQVRLVQVLLVQVLLLSRFGWSRFCCCPGSVGAQVWLVQVLLVSRFGWFRFCCCPGSVGPGSVGVQVRLVQVLLVQFLCPESHTVLAMVLCSVAPPPQVTGVVLLSVGLWWRFLLGPYMLLISGSPSNAPYVLTGTGAAIVLFGLFGCFSACRGRPWMLRLYAAFLFLVFMTELIAGISGFVFRHEIKGTFLTTYSDAVLRYDGRDDRSLAVDGVQRRLHCCGVQNFTSWLNSFYFPLGGIPVSCCVDLSDCSADDLKNATAAARKVHKQGCYELVVSFLETHMGIIAGVMFGVAFSQLVGTSLACCLSRFINANQYEMV